METLCSASGLELPNCSKSLSGAGGRHLEVYMTDDEPKRERKAQERIDKAFAKAFTNDFVFQVSDVILLRLFVGCFEAGS